MMKRLASAALAVTIGFTAIAAAPLADARERYWQCVTFAREFSGIQIFGDAWTWWGKAAGNFRTGKAPETGSVLVFQPHGRMTRGHVAVVSEILTDRVMQITHANWGGSRGKIEENVTVVDVSDANDWSRVKVWYNPINDLGTTIYPTYGFIYKTVESSLPSDLQIAEAPAAAETAPVVASSAGQP